MSEKTIENGDAARGSPNMVVWKCPICMRIPPGRIYQCSSGHSFCDACIVDKKSCPQCNVKMFGSKHGFYGVRNLLAESFLDQMKFECRWKDHGCKALETRSQISKHEYACIYGPVNLCDQFYLSIDCKFQVNLYKSLNVDKILNHIKIAHGAYTLKTGVEFESSILLGMGSQLRKRLEDQTKSCIVPVFVELVHFTDENFSKPSRELFIVFRKVEVGLQRNVSLSWLCVWLTSEAKENNFSVKMKITIEGKPKASLATNIRNDCVPDVSWTLNPIRAPEFAEWKLKPNHKIDFPFSLPLSHISNHYVDNEDNFTVSISFLKG